jgi:dTDP-4-amino-4,6-dideoxy-D-glucose acyltransferase
MNANYSLDELTDIHRTVLFFGDNIQIGSNVRIDAYSVITSGEPVKIGNHVHISVGVYIFGGAGVILEDFSGLSARCTIFTSSDDYSEGYLTNPCVPDQYKKVVRGAVKLEKHVIVGSGSIIMPGVVLGTGVSVGALTYINKNIPEYSIAVGIPFRVVGVRNKDRLLQLEEEFNKSHQAAI